MLVDFFQIIYFGTNSAAILIQEALGNKNLLIFHVVAIGLISK